MCFQRVHAMQQSFMNISIYLVDTCACLQVKLLFLETSITKPRLSRPSSTMSTNPFAEMTHSNPSLSVTLVSQISVPHGQLRSENIKGKIPEINNSCALNCELFWVAWWDLALSLSVLPGTWLVPWSRVFTLDVSHLVASSVIRSTVVVSQCLCPNHTDCT